MLASEIRAAGGVVSENDIRNYTTLEHDPVATKVMGFEFRGASGSSSGGAVVAAILEFMSGYPEPLVSIGCKFYVLTKSTNQYLIIL